MMVLIVAEAIVEVTTMVTHMHVDAAEMQGVTVWVDTQTKVAIPDMATW